MIVDGISTMPTWSVDLLVFLVLLKLSHSPDLVKVLDLVKALDVFSLMKSVAMETNQTSWIARMLGFESVTAIKERMQEFDVIFYEVLNVEEWSH